MANSKNKKAVKKGASKVQVRAGGPELVRSESRKKAARGGEPNILLPKVRSIIGEKRIREAVEEVSRSRRED